VINANAYAEAKARQQEMLRDAQQRYWASQVRRDGTSGIRPARRTLRLIGR
jgi:hypothetical protein